VSSIRQNKHTWRFRSSAIALELLTTATLRLRFNSVHVTALSTQIIKITAMLWYWFKNAMNPKHLLLNKYCSCFHVQSSQLHSPNRMMISNLYLKIKYYIYLKTQMKNWQNRASQTHTKHSRQERTLWLALEARNWWTKVHTLISNTVCFV
jgi:hypothetical protein